MGRVVLIGHPVAHSLSPAMHNAAFAALGLPHRYEAQDVPEDTLARVVEALHGEDWLGANVTVPHKESVVRLLDEVSAEAKRIGAVNTIVRRGARLVGDNTDRHGFARAVPSLSGRTVLVLGAGGVARAVVAELAPANEVIVASRRLESAQRVVSELASGTRGSKAISWAEARRLVTVDVVVNATPLGLHGEDALAGFALDPLPPLVVDLVPTAEETPLVRRARAAAGAQDTRVVDGLAMLLYQAARSFTFWTGREAPLRVMAGALPRPVPVTGRGA